MRKVNLLPIRPENAGFRGEPVFWDRPDLLSLTQINGKDFEKFDLILVMDLDNLAQVQQECPAQHQHKVRRLTEFCHESDSQVVPDPYYGGGKGFDHVLDLVEDACEGLMQHVKAKAIQADLRPRRS